MQEEWKYHTTTTMLSLLQQSNSTNTSSTTNNNQTIAFSGRGESIANLTVDGVTIIVTSLILLPMLIVYVKREAYLLLSFLFYQIKKMCGVKDHDVDAKITSRGFFFILMHSSLLFLLYRIGVEVVTILQHQYDMNRVYEPFVICLQVRRILDYVGMYWFLLNYSLIIPIWLKVCLAWIEDKRRKSLLVWSIYVLLLLCNVLAICGLAPVTGVAIAALIYGESTNGGSFDGERLRNIFTYGVAVPLLGSSTAIVFFMSIAAVVIIVRTLRRANKLHPENSEVYKMQRQTIIKLTVGVAVIGSGVIIESIGVAISVVTPNYIMYPLAKGIPYVTLAVCISLIFWPFRLPIINSDPLQFVIQELKFIMKKDNTHMELQEDPVVEPTEVDLKESEVFQPLPSTSSATVPHLLSVDTLASENSTPTETISQ